MHNSAFNLQVILVFPSEVSETLQDLKMQMYDLVSYMYSFTLVLATHASPLYLEKRKTDWSQSMTVGQITAASACFDCTTVLSHCHWFFEGEGD